MALFIQLDVTPSKGWSCFPILDYKHPKIARHDSGGRPKEYVHDSWEGVLASAAADAKRFQVKFTASYLSYWDHKEKSWCICVNFDHPMIRGRFPEWMRDLSMMVGFGAEAKLPGGPIVRPVHIHVETQKGLEVCHVDILRHNFEESSSLFDDSWRNRDGVSNCSGGSASSVGPGSVRA